jgi:hypothetical protein
MSKITIEITRPTIKVGQYYLNNTTLYQLIYVHFTGYTLINVENGESFTDKMHSLITSVFDDEFHEFKLVNNINITGDA